MIVIEWLKQIVKIYSKIEIFMTNPFNTNIASIVFTGYGSAFSFVTRIYNKWDVSKIMA